MGDHCLSPTCINEVTAYVDAELRRPPLGPLIPVEIPLCREHYEAIFGEVGGVV